MPRKKMTITTTNETGDMTDTENMSETEYMLDIEEELTEDELYELAEDEEPNNQNGNGNGNGTKPKRQKTEPVTFNTVDIDGVQYVTLEDLGDYKIIEQRKQLNCLPSLKLYKRVEKYCNDVQGGLSKSKFLIDAINEYLDKLDKAGLTD